MAQVSLIELGQVGDYEIRLLKVFKTVVECGGFSAAESYAWHRPLLQQHAASYDPRVRARIERGAGRALHAMIRPEGLRQPVEFTLSERFDVVLAGKTAVVSRVPVLACDNCFTTGFAPVNQRVGHVNGAVTFGDGQRTARAEIILQIDQ